MSDPPEEAFEGAARLGNAGDPRAGLARLAPWLGPEATPRALWLAGELAEQAGDPEAARRFYERILAVDLAHPGVRERVEGLRPPARPAVDAGVTVLAHGVLTSGRYRIVRELGRGGAGTVFLARDLRLDRSVALKIYHRRGPADRRRLRHEARVAADLEHPGVIRILDVAPPLGAIAMEVVAGGSLKAALRRGDLDGDRVRQWMASLLEALSFVHERGWVHRDLKPSNLLVRPDGRLVVTDFGLAMRCGAPLDAACGEGSVGFMAPEEGRGMRVGPAADAFALGATLDRLLGAMAGSPPGGWVELARACQNDRPEMRPTIIELAEAFR